MKKPLVGILMGSESDLPAMKGAAEFLDELGIEYELQVVSAHRTPEKALEYGKRAEERGVEVIIAGAGGAAHLPGVIASWTSLPVIGVPVKTEALGGLDSLLSIVQMPPGVPVATVGINGAKNAGILAAQILGLKYPEIKERIKTFKENLRQPVKQKGKEAKRTAANPK